MWAIREWWEICRIHENMRLNPFRVHSVSQPNMYNAFDLRNSRKYFEIHIQCIPCDEGKIEKIEGKPRIWRAGNSVDWNDEFLPVCRELQNGVWVVNGCYYINGMADSYREAQYLDELYDEWINCDECVHCSFQIILQYASPIEFVQTGRTFNEMQMHRQRSQMTISLSRYK